MNMQTKASSFGIAGAMKRYSLVHRAGETNHCPGCDGTNWHVGRVTAECAHCHTALSLNEVAAQPARPRFVSRSSRTAERSQRQYVGAAA